MVDLVLVEQGERVAEELDGEVVLHDAVMHKGIPARIDEVGFALEGKESAEAVRFRVRQEGWRDAMVCMG